MFFYSGYLHEQIAQSDYKHYITIVILNTDNHHVQCTLECVATV